MPRGIVFRGSLLLVLLVIAFGLYSLDLLSMLSESIHSFIIVNFGWGYLLAAFLFLIFCFVLALSRYGKIKLGRDDEKPDYTYFSWFSMMFAAGMGIGLIFWGVAEPLNHYMAPPEYIGAETASAANFAMQYSFLHWGFHPWAIYIIMSLCLAYFSFRRGMPPLISSCFYPLLGEKIYGFAGNIIDILAVLATIFGVATSLGFGALQINSGLSSVYGLPETQTTTLIIIGIVTVLFIASSITGVDKGIQILSRSNIMVAGLLLLFMLVVGPTAYIFNIFSNALGTYLNQLLEMSLQTHAFQGYDWAQNWTLFYWAWWISWSPFVGLFVARISRGRTIREFIFGALLVPSLLTFLWFSVFGGAALELQIERGINVGQSAMTNVSTTLFEVFSHYPLGDVLSTVAVILLMIFFITSADSATFVLGMMTSEGSLNPPLYKKITWGITQSLIAAILLLAGGLNALQQMAINAALPFAIVMVVMCYNLVRALGDEEKPKSFYTISPEDE